MSKDIPDGHCLWRCEIFSSIMVESTMHVPSVVVECL